MSRPACWWPQEPRTWLGSTSGGGGRWSDIPVNEDLRHAVVYNPEDDTPRREYAEWLSAQESKLARQLGAFITAQLRVAAAFRRDRRSNVSALRSWTGDGRFVRPEQYVSPGAFRAGDALRPWYVSSLGQLPGIGWPQVFRGFVERVWMRARTFLQYAPRLFEAAPIRYLVLVDVPDFARELAACGHLRRIRSLSLVRYRQADALDDTRLGRVLESPHLGNLVHLRLVHQCKLTRASYANAVNSLPLLSSLEVFLPRPEWEFCTSFDGWSRCERVMTVDSVISAVRSQEWIDAIEQRIGPVPCLRPDVYYGPESDLEAFIENPIALDPRISVRRGHATQAPALESNG